MRLKDVAEMLEGNVVYGLEQIEKEVEFAFASDLMSDVLTLQKDNVILLTGLANVQALRTAEMSDISCIVFVRNKKVNEDMLKLGKESGIVLIECPCSMFKASGVLFNNGLKPIF
ncbi:MAG: hypothetical protein HOO91_15640 [Bacteroidales bacterium]|nr:hypothetical protein [Bacteroidales bacterium]